MTTDTSREALLEELAQARRRVAELEANEELRRLPDAPGVRTTTGADDALRASEERYRRMLASVTNYIYTVTVENGQVVSTSHGPGCLAVTGYTSDEYAQNPNLWYQMVHPDDRQAVLEQTLLVLNGLACSQLEHRIIHKDGSTRWIANTLVSRCDACGRVFLYDGLIADITGRKLAEMALRDSEAKFRRLFDNVSSIAVQGYTQDRMVMYWNRASTELYGYTQEEAMGRRIEELIVPPARREKAVQAIHRWIENGVSIPNGELALMRKDGSLVQVFSNHVMQEANTGGFELFGLDLDLTDLSRARDELTQAKEQAEFANRAKSEFLANMSHEIRTPLNGILGMLGLLKETSLTKEQEEYAATAIQSGNVLLRVIKDILDLSKIEAGKLDILIEPLEVRELLDAVVTAFAWQTSRKRLDISLCLDDRVPRYVFGDPARLRQVLFNLVGNAVKFTEAGSIGVSAAPDHTGALLVFTVEDTGIGIPAEKLEEVFTPFTQVDGSYTRRFQGTGLGLAIVKRLVNLMGGQVRIDSLQGQGTTVTFAVPLKVSARLCALKPTRSVSSVPHNRKVLLAEDDLVNQLTMRRMLEKRGFTVLCAGNGKEALSILAVEPVDAVLMDIQMPEMDGIAATQAIRDLEQFGNAAHIPIIAITAHAMAGDKEIFLAAGMDDYVAKPVDFTHLFQVLNRLLTAATLSATAGDSP